LELLSKEQKRAGSGEKRSNRGGGKITKRNWAGAKISREKKQKILRKKDPVGKGWRERKPR